MVSKGRTTQRRNLRKALEDEIRKRIQPGRKLVIRVENPERPYNNGHNGFAGTWINLPCPKDDKYVEGNELLIDKLRISCKVVCSTKSTTQLSRWFKKSRYKSNLEDMNINAYVTFLSVPEDHYVELKHQCLIERDKAQSLLKIKLDDWFNAYYAK